MGVVQAVDRRPVAGQLRDGTVRPQLVFVVPDAAPGAAEQPGVAQLQSYGVFTKVLTMLSLSRFSQTTPASSRL